MGPGAGGGMAGGLCMAGGTEGPAAHIQMPRECVCGGSCQGKVPCSVSEEERWEVLRSGPVPTW